MSTTVTISLTEREYAELQSVLLRYSTGTQHWAISSALKQAVADAVVADDEGSQP